MALDKVLSTSIANGAVTAAAISNTANLVVGSISANGAELTSINATSISTGTLDTARLPATANIATAVNVGANVNITTTGISVGNSTVNTAISSGKIVFGNNATQTADISFPTTAGVKLDLYNSNNTDRYSIQIQPSELRLTSGIQGDSNGGITLGAANSTVFSEHVRVRNDGSVFIGDPQYLGNSSTDTPNYRILRLDNTYGANETGAAANKIRLHQVPSWVGGFGITDSTLNIHSGGRVAIWRGSNTSSYGTLSAEFTSGNGLRIPSQPAFVASRSGSTNAGSVTKSTFDVNESSSHPGSSHFSTTNNRFTAPVAGMYFFYTRSWFIEGASGTIWIYFNINGATTAEMRKNKTSSTSEYCSFYPSMIRYLNVNDYVEVFIQGSATNHHTSSSLRYSEFSGFLIG